MDTDSNLIVVTSSSTDYRVRVYRIDPKTRQSLLLSVIEAPPTTLHTVRIDPAIVRLKDTWLVTYTTIDGPINSPEPKGPFGTYEMHLFSSPDLVNWTYRTRLLKEDRNLEDPRFLYLPESKKLLFFYEQETYDRGPSTLKVTGSDDAGLNWSQPIQILDQKNDVEPGGAFEHDNKVYLFYSSDQEAPGSSYAGGKVFYLFSRDNGHSWHQGGSLPFGSSLLLMDTIKKAGQLEFGAIKDYLAAQKALSGQTSVSSLQ